MDSPSNQIQIQSNLNANTNNSLNYNEINQNTNTYFNKSNQEINSIEIKLIQNIERIWRNEKFCKDLLKFDEEIISEIVEKIEQRVKKLKIFFFKN